MEGSEYQVAGERGLNGDVSGFLVPHFADHDDVGTSTQKRPHCSREGQPDLRMDLDLAQAFLGDFTVGSSAVQIFRSSAL
jgi:hypothetical protein